MRLCCYLLPFLFALLALAFASATAGEGEGGGSGETPPGEPPPPFAGEWGAPPTGERPEPTYARFLGGVRLCLDPGHGGDAHRVGYKRGPTGLREAEVNLRVALELAAMLRACGVEVVLTRTEDVEVSLAERGAIAARAGADLFISLHHNAAAASPSPTNYTSVWYHREPDLVPASCDLARHLFHSVNEALRPPQLLPCGLLADTLIFPESGFGVLRGLAIPGVLVEASFHSCPEEETRLADPEYNRREAYGYFLGIARYLYGGIPGGEPAAPLGTLRERRPTLRFTVRDGLSQRGGWGSTLVRVFADSLRVRLDGESAPFRYEASSGLLEVTPASPLGAGEHAVEVSVRNLFGNHSWPRRHTFRVAPLY